MSKKHNGVNYPSTAKVIARRKSVIERLEAQLKRGMKSHKESHLQILLTDNDIKRINRELDILKSRLVKRIK